MLVKILTRKNPAAIRSLINYIVNPDKTAREPMVITHNLRSSDKEGYIREFYENELYRTNKRSNSIYIYHELFSIASDDRESVTQAMLDDLTREYIRLRGKDSIVLAYAHHDRSHIHVHLAVHGLKYRQSVANRLSREALHTLKVEFQKFHQTKYPALDKSICEHGSGREYISNKEFQLKARTKRTLVKEDVAKMVRECFDKAKTQHEFIEMLMHHELPSYERKGIATGVVHGNLKFRFSRLGIEKHELERLPIDKTPEQQALDEIRVIRERASARDSRELER